MIDRASFKYIFTFVLLICAYSLFDAITYEFNFLFNTPRQYLDLNMTSNRNSCIIDDAVFYTDVEKQKVNHEWYVKVGKTWHNTSDVKHLDTVLVLNDPTDSIITYKFLPDFHQSRFGHEFESVHPEFFYSDYTDSIGSYVGIYKHSFKIDQPVKIKHTNCVSDECNLKTLYYKLRLEIFETHANLKRITQQTFTKSSTLLLEEYLLDDIIYFKSPMLYIPFPLSNKGYMFTGDILKPHFVHGMYYFILVHTPSDIRKIGEVIACDENGVLLSVGYKKTPNMRIHLKRLKEDSQYYFAYIKYNKTHSRDLINDVEYQMIINNQDNAVSYNIFDKQVFINLSQMLSKFEIDES